MSLDAFAVREINELIKILEARQEEYTKKANMELTKFYITNCAGHVGELTFVIEKLTDILEKIYKGNKKTG